MLIEEAIVVKEILEEVFDPPAGRAGSPLHLSLRVSFTGFYLLGEDLENLAVSALNISQPFGYTSTDQPIQFNVTNLKTDELGIFHLTLEASRNIVREIDKFAIADSVRGRPVEEVGPLLAGRWSGRKIAESLNPAVALAAVESI
jgi:hypothetical protein